MKIFFGYAAGVGKTFSMLEAAHRAKEAGVDVVVGYVEPHTRPETLALLDDLEILQPLCVQHKGISLNEFDLDRALERSPQLILVDELAHTNADACRHTKRYQDIEELLRAGIDVYTTVNVQHLESINDVVASITGVVVTERVPDRIFDTAEQVELVDLEPDDLIDRLRQGKIYRQRQAQSAMENFFIQTNLAALREIALRRTADRLTRTAKRANTVTRAGEHIMICLSGSPSNTRVIRAAARMAEAFHCDFTALFVETPDFSATEEDALRRLRLNLKLAEDLGARIATVYGEDIAAQIAAYANDSGVSKIVLGRTNNRRSLISPRKTLIDRLTELAPSVDVYIIPDHQPSFRTKRAMSLRSQRFRITPQDLLKSILVVLCSTAISWVFDHLGFSETNIVTVYILGVLSAAVWTDGRFYGGLISLLSVLAFNFFFTDPRFTLNAYDAGYPVTFLIMFASSLIVSSLTIRVKAQARQAARNAYRTEVLLQSSQRLQKAASTEELYDEIAQQLLRLLDCPLVLYPATNGQLAAPRIFSSRTAGMPPECLTADEQAVAQWVLKNNKHAGATTNTLPSAKCLYLAVRGRNAVFAVAGLDLRDEDGGLDAFEKNLLIALLDECGLALEKQQLDDENKEIELKAQQEQLRANLLRAISHDLRTPLTSISGNAGILMSNAAILAPQKRQQLYTDIYDDAMWLVNLVENLLSVTRIENGAMRIHTEPELLDDVMHEALRHLDRQSVEHTITTDLPDDFLMAKMDARLIVQVLINLVNNAIKYTPAGSTIRLSAQPQGEMVSISVADNGPGIGAESKKKLFDMFFTTDGNRTDSRRGLGLGLSLCKSIVEAHGGTITVSDAQPQGSVFAFTLPSAEVTTHV